MPQSSQTAPSDVLPLPSSAVFSEENSFLKNADQVWSYSEPVEGTRRFEVRAGDYFDNPNSGAEQDDETLEKNRSELGSRKHMQFERAFVLEFDLMVESGAENSAEWLLLAQLHQTEDVGLDGAASPPVALQLRGEHMEISGRTHAAQEMPAPPPGATEWPPKIQLGGQDTMYLDSQPITRDQWYRMRFEVTFDHNTDGVGQLRVYRDGVQLVDYVGPLGYNDAIGPYLQLGVYRKESQENFAAQFRNISWEGAGYPAPIEGSDADDSIDAGLVGFWESEVLYGYGGNDTLNGGVGEDTMHGGSGNDVYIVDNLGDVVNERNSGLDQGGIDQVRSYVDWTLNTDIENLLMQGTGALSATGNSGANRLQGNAGDNLLQGLGGDDELLAGDGRDVVEGGEGHDRLFGGSGADTLQGGEGRDQLFGETGDDLLEGGGGNDQLEGGTGNDTLIGGAGDDAYVAESIGDVVIELSGGGRDTVRAAVSFDAGVSNNIEVLNTTNQAAFIDLDLAGSDIANEMRGNEGQNVLSGRGGNDVLYGYGGDDTLEGGEGHDSLIGGGGDDRLNGGAGQDTLRGGDGSDTLSGGEGDDLLYGDGSDVAARGGTLEGGLGDDTYYIDALDYIIVERGGEGNDLVRTSVSLALSADSEIEDLRASDLSGLHALNLTGSDTDNQINGNDGSNVLDGRGGNDTMYGRGGEDVFIVSDDGDQVHEFAGHGEDTIRSSVNYSLGSTQYIETLQASVDSGLTLVGNQLDNTILGARGDDWLSGKAGDDTLQGGWGDDTIYGGAGIDTLIIDVASTSVAGTIGGSSIVLESAEGRDVVVNDVEYVQFLDRRVSYAEAGLLNGSVPARIEGTSASENVVGTGANEQIFAGEGSDWITPGGGSDTIDGGAGNDMVSFINLIDNVGRGNTQYRLDIDLADGTAANHDGSEVIELIDIERVTGTIFADRIRGDDGANHLRGQGDYDWFIATNGNDTLEGGTGQDMVSYLEWQNSAANEAVDVFNATGAPPTTATGVVVDLRDPGHNSNLAAGHVYSSIERITGSGRQDVFYGDGNQNDFRGLGDYDWFVGSSGGRERYFGGDGLDTVTYFLSEAGVIASLRNGAVVNGQESGYGTGGDAARDLYFEIENLVGTNYADQLTGNGERNQISGLDGDDFIFGYGGIDQLKGGAGDDTINGGSGSDYAIYEGNTADYNLTRLSGSEVQISGAEGTDLLIDVEYFRFADGDVTIWEL